MAIELVNADINWIFHPSWNERFKQSRVNDGKKYLDNTLFTVTRKDGAEFKVTAKQFINTVADYYKAEAVEYKSQDQKERITNHRQARFFKTGLVATLGYTGKYGVDSSIMPQWLLLFQKGEFTEPGFKNNYIRFYDRVDENAQKYFEWMFTEPRNFYKAHLDAKLDEDTPDVSDDTDSFSYVYLILFIFAIYLIFRK